MVVVVLMVMMMVVMVLVDNDMFGDGSFVSGALGNSVPLTKVNGFPEMRKEIQTHKYTNTQIHLEILVSL